VRGEQARVGAAVLSEHLCVVMDRLSGGNAMKQISDALGDGEGAAHGSTSPEE